ncbi:Putative transposase (identified by ISEscan HMM) [Escherichia coli]|nr:Putative transposase (identified by ISEscan HMM) [Escherichia coli]
MSLVRSQQCTVWSSDRSRRMKSNEITAIPELLNMMDIKGKIITDAMG